MKGVAYWFMLTAVVAVSLGMIWGIQMSATGDHLLSPAHAHLNLLGWVTMAIFAIYYHIVPEAAETTLAKVHFALAFVGLVLIVPGIVMAVRETGETLAKIGSTVTELSMLVFLYTVARRGLAGRNAVPAE